MKGVLVILIVFLTEAMPLAFAEEVIEVRNMGQMLTQIKLEKKQMESMVDKLVDSGRISPENAVKVRREIASVKEEDAEQVKNHIITIINSQKN